MKHLNKLLGKRGLSLLLTVILLCTMLPLGALAEEIAVHDDSGGRTVTEQPTGVRDQTMPEEEIADVIEDNAVVEDDPIDHESIEEVLPEEEVYPEENPVDADSAAFAEQAAALLGAVAAYDENEDANGTELFTLVNKAQCLLALFETLGTEAKQGNIEAYNALNAFILTHQFNDVLFDFGIRFTDDEAKTIVEPESEVDLLNPELVSMDIARKDGAPLTNEALSNYELKVICVTATEPDFAWDGSSRLLTSDEEEVTYTATYAILNKTTVGFVMNANEPDTVLTARAAFVTRSASEGAATVDERSMNLSAAAQAFADAVNEIDADAVKAVCDALVLEDIDAMLSDMMAIEELYLELEEAEQDAIAETYNQLGEALLALSDAYDMANPNVDASGTLNTQTTGDLKNCLAGLELYHLNYDGSWVKVNGTDVVTVGDTYRFDVSFEENPTGNQFGNPATFEFPSDIKLTSGGQGEIRDGAGTLLGKYVVNPSNNTVTVNFEDINGVPWPDTAVNCGIKLKLEAQFNGNKDDDQYKIDLGSVTMLVVNLKTKASLDVDKQFVEYDPKTRTAKYTVSVKANGEVTDAKLIDKHDDKLSLDGTKVDVDGQSVAAKNVGSDTFEVDLGVIKTGETKTVTYTMKVDDKAFDSKETENRLQLANKSTVEGKDKDKNKIESSDEDKFTAVQTNMKKDGEWDEGKSLIKWTITLGDGYTEGDVAGKITDVLDPNLELDGNITIEYMRYGIWITKTVSKLSDISIPKDASNAKVTYYTKYKNQKAVGPTVYTNTATHDKGWSSGKEVTVQGIQPGIKKTHTAVDDKTITYQVTIDAPKGIDKSECFYYHDTLKIKPKSGTNLEAVIDPQNIKVTVDDVDYTNFKADYTPGSGEFFVYFEGGTDTSTSKWTQKDAATIVITYDVKLTNAVPGGDADHDTIKKALANGDTLNNHAYIYFTSDGKYKDSEDDYYIRNSYMKKTVLNVDTATATTPGIIEYRVEFKTGVTKKDSHFVFRDTFDDRLSYVVGSLYVEKTTIDKNGSNTIKYYYEGLNPSVFDFTTGKGAIEFTSSSFKEAPKLESMSKYNSATDVYVVHYKLQVPQDVNLSKEVYFKNTAYVNDKDTSDNICHDTTGVGYPNDLLDKEAAQNVKEDDIIEYTIKVNPARQKLNANPAKNTIQLHDTQPGDVMALRPTTIKVTQINKDSSETELSNCYTIYNGGTEIVFTLPDQEYIVITYQMKITSTDATVRAVNNVKLEGYDDYVVDSIKQFQVDDSEASGTAEHGSLTLYKVDKDTKAPLAGAKFKLYSETQNTNDQDTISVNNNTKTLKCAATKDAKGNWISDVFETNAQGYVIIDHAVLVLNNNNLVYALVEQKEPTGYKLDQTPYVFEFHPKTPDSTVYYMDGSSVVIENGKTTVDVEGKKTWDHGTNTNKPTSITIRLSASVDGQPISLPNGVPDHKVVSITATDDGSWSWKNLPEYSDGKKITYTITEDPVSNYSTVVTGYNVKNTFDAGPEPTELPIGVEKTILEVSGKVPSALDFDFTITPLNNAPAPMKNGSASTTATVKGEGTALFGTIEFTKAGNYSYEITETDKSKQSGYENYSFAAKQTVTVVVGQTGKTLTITSVTGASDITVAGETVKGAVMTNNYTAKPAELKLPVTKTVSGPARPAAGTTFTFELSTTNNAPMPTEPKADPNHLTITDDGKKDFKASDTFKTIEYPNATPANAPHVYEIRESSGGGSGFTNSTLVYTVEVAVTDDGQGGLKATPTYYTDYTKKTTATDVTFDNVYKLEDGELEIPVEKKLTGDKTPNDKTFKFTIEATAGTPMPNPDYVEITGANTGKFPTITYSEVTSTPWVYTVREVDGKANGYRYDGAVYTVEVTVTNNSGTLVPTYVIKDAKKNTVGGTGKTVTAVTFTNEYTTTDATLGVPVQKTIKGSKRPSEKTFTFNIQAVNNGPMPKTYPITVNGEGTVSFENFTFTSATTTPWKYLITESNLNATGYNCDTNQYLLEVTVTDVDSQLVAEYVIKNNADATKTLVDDKDAPIQTIPFTNTYTTTDGKLTLGVKKQVNGPTPNDEDFKFTISSDMTGAPLPNPASVTVKGSGTASFAEITYTEATAANTPWVYKITETDSKVDGYDYDPAEYTVEVTVTDKDSVLTPTYVIKKDGKEEDGQGSKFTEILFTNTYTTTDATLNLPVQKLLKGKTPPSDNTFTFKIATSMKDAPMPKKDTLDIIGASKDRFGTITYTAVTPANTPWKYTVTEVDPNAQDGYTYDGTEYTVEVTVTDKNSILTAEYVVKDKQGVVIKDSKNAPIQTLPFTNTYDTDDATLEIPVEKKLTGDKTPSDKDFKFTISTTNNAPMPNPDYVKITGAGTGKFPTVTYTAPTPANTPWKYTVVEVDPQTPDGYKYDGNKYAVEVTVTDVGGKLVPTYVIKNAENVQIGGSDETMEAVTFTNEYKTEGCSLNIPVEKLLTGDKTPDDKTFEFTLEAVTAGAPMPTDKTTTATVTGAGTGAFSDIDYTEATDASKPWIYLVKETDKKESGYGYDSHSYYVKVTVTDNGGALAASYVITDLDGNLKGGSAETVKAVTFTNTYTTKSCKLSLPVKKQINGTTPKDKEFEFTIESDNTKAPLPDPDSVTVMGAKTVSFADITYKEATPAKTPWVYTIKETDKKQNGYTYDGAEYTVEVTVTDVNGQLTPSYTIKKDGKDKDDQNNPYKEIIFTNTYKVNSTTVELPVEKAFSATAQARPTKEKFTFTLSVDQAAGGPALTPMPKSGGETVQIEDVGTDKFGAIEFTAADTYYYEVKESDDGKSGYGYDPVAKKFKVVVTDNDGQLEANWSVDNNDKQKTAVFTNNYNTTNAKLTLPVEKIITGSKTPDDKIFTFTIESDDANAPMPVNGKTLSITGAASNSFSEITYTKTTPSGTPWVYTVKETDTKEDGYKYSDMVYKVYVTVTNNNSVLRASYVLKDKNDNELTGVKVMSFTNTYSTTSCSLTIPVEKKVTGPTPSDKTFAFTITPEDSNAPKPKNSRITISGTGSASFDGFSFTQATPANAPWKYTVKEDTSVPQNGYKYDTNEYTIEVTVTDIKSKLQAEYVIKDSKGTTVGGSGETVKAVGFANEYETTDGKLELPVEKKISGSTPPDKKSFNFTISSAMTGAPMPKDKTITINGANTSAFTDFVFTKATTTPWVYTVSEDTTTAISGYDFDKNEYTVYITVTDVDSKLVPEYVIRDKDNNTVGGTGKAVTAVTFTNKYTTKDGKLTLPVTKQVNGTTPDDKEFKFTISSAMTGAPLPNPAYVTVKGSNTVSFADITFKEVTPAKTPWVYTIKETDSKINGYTYDGAEYTVEVTVTDVNSQLTPSFIIKKDGKEKDAQNNPYTEIIFTNTYKVNPTSVELPVEKTFTSTSRTRPTKEKFTFRLSVDAASTKPGVITPMPKSGGEVVQITDAGNAKFGAIEFTAPGTYYYEAKEDDDGKSGYGYDGNAKKLKVEVVDNDGNLKATWSVDGDSSKQTAVFTNSYNTKNGTLEIPVEKKITGPAPDSKTFEFTITSSDASAPMPKDKTISIRGNGTNSFTGFTFTDVTTTPWKYTIQEKNVNPYPGYDYDGAVYTLEVSVADVNSQLTPSYTVKKDGKDVTGIKALTFENAYATKDGTLEIPVEKLMNGNRTPNDKTFTFTLKAEDPNAPMPTNSIIQITGTGKQSFTGFVYKTTTPANKPWKYTITEVDGKEDGYTYDTAKYTVEVTVTDVDSQLTPTCIVRKDGQALGSTIQTLSFTNTYKVKPTSVDLPVKKEIPDVTPDDKDFTFTLEAVTKGAPLPTNTTVTIKGSGEASFADIPFTAAGRYEYTIKETVGTEPGYTYDKTVHSIVVTVTDVNAALQATWTDNGTAGSKVTFTNRFKAVPVNVELLATKVLKNLSLTEGMFSFELKDSAGKVLETAKNAADGSIAFKALEFSTPGTYTYTVSEVSGSQSHVTYDKTEYTVTVTVTEKNAVLTAKTEVKRNKKTVQSGEMTFTNTYSTSIPRTGYGPESEDDLLKQGLGSLMQFIRSKLDGMSAEEVQSEAREAYGAKDEVTAGSLTAGSLTPVTREGYLDVQKGDKTVWIHEDFAELYEKNEDLIGWLKAGDSIDDPVVQKDNEYYLNYNFDREKSSNGAIFLNMANTLDPRDDVLLIHGHNMASGAIFGRLTRFESESYLKKYPVVTFRTIYDAEDVYYTPVAGFNASMMEGENGYFDVKPILFDDEEAHSQYLKDIKKLSLWKAKPDVTTEDKLIVLITCSYKHTDGRFLLICRALREDETPESIAELYA